MKRSRLMVHLATANTIPDQTPDVMDKEPNNASHEEFSNQLANVSELPMLTQQAPVTIIDHPIQKDYFTDVTDTIQADTQPPASTISDFLQPIAESVPQDDLNQVPYEPNHEPAARSIENILMDTSNTVPPITEPTLPSQVSYKVIDQECQTKIKLRKIVELPYNETNSSGEEENFWGETDSDNYSPSSSDESTSGEDSKKRADKKEKSPMRSPQSSPQKGRKRQRHPEKWKKSQAKLLKNLGKSYKSRTGKTIKERVMGPPCPDKCKLKCSSKFSDERRSQFFSEYWQLASLQRQRDFLASCVAPLELKYRRIRSELPRNPNCAFYLWDNGKKNRVCKKYMINTFGITERTIRTIIQARATNSGIIPEDKRGRHGNHKKIDEEIIESVKKHINSIPRVESHYQRLNTTREFIPGELTISEMHRNYIKERSGIGKPAANYDLYSRIFNTHFNIGFFFPRKDMCDLCEGYHNSTEDDKKRLENDYVDHQEEKKLSRIEKDADKKKSKEEGSNMVFAVYDLQAVLPVPMGQSSAFFYKSRLNCFNFTVTDISSDNTLCFFWHEGLGHRGAVEIGSCVLTFIEEIATSRPGADIVFYSDNCCGQQKNKFVFAMYFFAVHTLPINSITHKYLIRGHTQNEGDTIHSIIEKSVKRAKKAGPIYVPHQLVTLIRTAKQKGNPLHVRELSFRDFVDLKQLNNDIGFNCLKNCNGDQIKVSEIKMIQFVKDSDLYFYKTSYKEAEWQPAKCRNIGSRRSSEAKSMNNILKKPAYNAKIPIAENKKKDLQSLLKSNIIPNHYESFFNSLV